MSEFITMGEPVVTFASTDADASLVDSTHYTKILGGAELNVAIGVQRLGHSTEYITQLGTDPLGKFAKKVIESHQIGTNYISFDSKHWTGHQLKQLVTHGDPETFNYRTNSAAANLSPDQFNNVDLSGIKIAHMSGIFPALSQTSRASFKKLMQELINQHIFITFDPNLRPSLWDNRKDMIKTINELAKDADIVMPGSKEGKVLIGTNNPETIANYYLKNGRRTSAVLVKIGPRGAYVKTKAGDSYIVPGFKAQHVVDTVGAGDGFAVGVISALLEHKSLKEAVTRGNAIGSLQVQTPGDNDGYPTPKELANFYHSLK
ncbi:2-dehydro-3-deoxygluconokinase [Philodulcilactobacillus myokoensis]|uniref:2-dehydro-3-deoxygluconokinase n=1 Tax=Philodulcilactobacillus myokoensis TaxID=2929573 RepID=A0A9W6EQR8_9LACO|nr:sugar kinase [Philodulcilactobacillus myokoensis]GLB46191.1 2-dehydro-3-deoxygluconokinase [Philodulcilactobacillus myokoensis]